MNSETLLLEDRDTSVTAFAHPAVSSRWQRPIYLGPRHGRDIFTAAVVLVGVGFDIVDPTSPFIAIFPQQPPIVPLDTWVEIDVRFRPKKTRPLMGKLVKRGRAEFRTAFADELIEV